MIDDARTRGARKHHLVPQHYLAGWAEGRQLRVTEVSSRRSYCTAPQNAARETDFYRIDEEEVDSAEVPPLLFETLLSKVEDRGADAIRAVINSGRVDLPDELRVWFALFMAFQVTRGRIYRLQTDVMANESFKIFLTHLTDEQLRRRLEELGEPVSDEAIRKQRDAISAFMAGRLLVKHRRASHVSLAGTIAIEMVPFLLERKWVLYRGTGNLITCDEPVVPIAGPPFTRNDGFGVGNAGCVIMALNPWWILAMFHPLLRLDHVALHPTLTFDEESELNNEIAAHATRWMFERPRTHQSTIVGIPPFLPRPSMQGPRSFVDEGRQGELFRLGRLTRWAYSSHPPEWPIKRWWLRLDPVWHASAQGWVRPRRAFADREAVFGKRS